MESNNLFASRLICRTCLRFDVELKPIYEADVAKMLNVCRFMQISANDGFPNKICMQCKELVLQSYNFKQQCKISQLKLKKFIPAVEIINLTSVKRVPDDKWKENAGLNSKVEITRYFNCDECQQNFVNESDFLLHKNSHGKPETFACTKCEKTFSSLQLLNKHGKNHNGEVFPHDNTKIAHSSESESDNKIEFPEDLTSFLYEESPPPLPFACKECSQSFDVEHDLRLHESTHSSSGQFVCSSCQKHFANRQMLKRHIKTHMMHKPHICQACGKGFAESHALTKHLRGHNGEPREKKHFCSVCGQGFSEPFYLNVHMRKHTGERPLICSSCGKSFADPRSLKAHNLIHTGEKPYKCNVCGKAFSQNVNLTKHVRVHTGEKPYNCTECGKCFTQSSTLDKHSRTHTGFRPYACEHCPKRFSERGTLVHHIRTHTGEKPYVCEQCGRAFASSSELKLHDRKHSGLKKNVCDICGKDFATPSNLRVHSRTHSGERPYICLICGKHFSDKGTLKKHQKIHSEKGIHFGHHNLHGVNVQNFDVLQLNRTQDMHVGSIGKMYINLP